MNTDQKSGAGAYKSDRVDDAAARGRDFKAPFHLRLAKGRSVELGYREAAVAAGVATGIQFAEVTLPHLTRAIARAVHLYDQRTPWTQMQKNGMRQDFSWGASGRRYAALFAQLAEGLA